ncbi:MAG: DUF2142 domain-containing protein [Lachnospiraceae bacterium]|nr:DUF2142 domain-containing protein [Lachnospiraceae bacterium]
MGSKKYRRYIGWGGYLAVCLILCVYIFNSSYSAYKVSTARLDITESRRLNSGEKLTQKIEGFGGNLKTVSVLFGTFSRVNQAELRVRFLKETELVREWKVDASELRDNSYKKFTLPRYYRMEEGCSYCLQIEETYEGDNALGVYLSAGGGGLSVSEGLAIDNRTVCYQLESINLKDTRVFQCLILFIMLLVFGFLAWDKKLNYIWKTIIAAAFTVVVSVMIPDLFEKVNTEVRIISFESNGGTEELQAGEIKKYELINQQCEFEVLELFAEGDDLDGLFVSVRNADKGELVHELDVDDNNLVTDSGTGRKAIWLSPGFSFEKGRYEIEVGNRGIVPIRLCTDDGNLNVTAIKHTKLGVYIGLLVLLLLVVYMVLLLCLTQKNETVSLEKFFLLTAVFIGLCHFILFAPWSVPDTNSHYPAVYRLSNMVLCLPEERHWYGRAEDVQFLGTIWEKDRNPGMLSYVDIAYNFHLFCRDKTLEELPVKARKMEYYSLLSFWPQTLGMVAGRLLGFSAIACAYLARFAMFLFYVWGCLRAIKITPVGKSIFAFIPLMPMALMNSSAISYDPLVLITTLNFTASILALYKNPESKRTLKEAVLWVFMVGATKGGGYLLLLPLVFILYDRSKKMKSAVRCLGILGSGLFSLLLFNKFLQIGKTLYQFGEEAGGKMEAVYALRHPVKYIQMCVLTYLDGANSIFFDMLGSNLGWLEAVVPMYVLSGLAIILVLYAVLEEDEVAIGKRHRYSFAAAAALIIVLTPAMLLSFTDKGSAAIAGLQGRYYIPAMTVGLLVLTKTTFRDVDFVFTDKVRRFALRNKAFYSFGLLLCLSVYYMMRLYLRR